MFNSRTLDPWATPEIPKFTQAQMNDIVRLYNLDPTRRQGYAYDSKEIHVPALGSAGNPMPMMRIQAEHLIKHSESARGDMHGWLTMDEAKYLEYKDLYEKRQDLPSPGNPHHVEEYVMHPTHGRIAMGRDFWLYFRWDAVQQEYYLDEMNQEEVRQYQKDQRKQRGTLADVVKLPQVREPEVPNEVSVINPTTGEVVGKAYRVETPPEVAPESPQAAPEAADETLCCWQGCGNKRFQNKELCKKHYDQVKPGKRGRKK